MDTTGGVLPPGIVLNATVVSGKYVMAPNSKEQGAISPNNQSRALIWLETGAVEEVVVKWAVPQVVVVWAGNVCAK